MFDECLLGGSASAAVGGELSSSAELAGDCGAAVVLTLVLVAAAVSRLAGVEGPGGGEFGAVVVDGVAGGERLHVGGGE